jgi:serine/threonine protein kinase
MSYTSKTVRRDRNPTYELETAIEDVRIRGMLSFPYAIHGLLGTGGMGAVYRAEHTDGRVVALKVMLPEVTVEDRMRVMFHRELATMAQLRHAKLVEMLDHGSIGSLFYVVLELCPQGSVDMLLSRNGTLSIPDATAIIFDVLEGLAYAHEQGFVHRDIKPHNILLDANGKGKLGDFGLAKSFFMAGLSKMTEPGEWEGTTAFMPREQVVNFRYAKPPTDVWAVGATLYFMITGRSPRDVAPGQDPFEAVLKNPIVPIRTRAPAISAKLAAVIDRALASDVRSRPANAAELARELAETT